MAVMVETRQCKKLDCVEDASDAPKAGFFVGLCKAHRDEKSGEMATSRTGRAGGGQCV